MQNQCSSPNESINADVIPKAEDVECERPPQYSMTRVPRGICLIVNNITFTQGRRLKKRKGSKVDEVNLKCVFEYLGFLVEVKRNQTSQEMKDVMSDMQKRDHTEYDCFVCCILSHGGLGTVAGSDGETCNIIELADGLRPDKCESLSRKPKVFFIQACRNYKQTEEDKLTPENNPSVPDFLLGYATTPLAKAKRNRKHGSYFIRNLTKALEERHHTDHILDILTHVNYEVSKITSRRIASFKITSCKKTSGGGGQVPSPQYTLTKRLYFPGLEID
ncbi:caspase-8-like [Antedon mediterranea]|uniref:caspase-8-like n=1 Tax=Antedon mediterranea TaxID=105859 RepID=UPI003AF5E93E